MEGDLYIQSTEQSKRVCYQTLTLNYRTQENVHISDIFPANTFFFGIR